MPKTTIVVPCYNEEKRLEVSSFENCLSAHADVSFLFVDDGSQDGTVEVLRRLADSSDRVELLCLEKNSGKAEAVRAGMGRALETDCEYAGYWDADLATPLNMIEVFVAELRKRDYAVALGCRLKSLGRNIQRKRARHYLGRVFATCVSFVLGIPVYDTQCGAKLFRNTSAVKEAFRLPFSSRWIFDVELLGRLLVQDNVHAGRGLVDNAVEVPLESWCDVAGSKLSVLDFVNALFDLFQIYRQISSGRRG